MFIDGDIEALKTEAGANRVFCGSSGRIYLINRHFNYESANNFLIVLTLNGEMIKMWE